jgi:hypothetical protein
MAAARSKNDNCERDDERVLDEVMNVWASGPRASQGPGRSRETGEAPKSWSLRTRPRTIVRGQASPSALTGPQLAEVRFKRGSPTVDSVRMAMTRERLFKAATEAEDAVRLVRRDLGLKRYDAADRKLKALEDLLEKLRRLLKQQARIGETEPEVMLEPTED